MKIIRYIVEVKVLCLDTNEVYTRQFKDFMEKDLKIKISWVPHEEKLNFSEGKYLLLVDVRTRVPEDVESTLDHYKLQGKRCVSCVCSILI